MRKRKRNKNPSPRNTKRRDQNLLVFRHNRKRRKEILQAQFHQDIKETILEEIETDRNNLHSEVGLTLGAEEMIEEVIK